MATHTITHKQVVANVATVQVLEPINFEVGQSITLAGMGAPFNGSHIITALPVYYFTGVSEQGDYEYDEAIIIPKQVQFALTTADVERVATTGTLTYSITCTWAALTDLQDYLGFTFSNAQGDLDVATMALGAANAFAFRRRLPRSISGRDCSMKVRRAAGSSDASSSGSLAAAPNQTELATSSTTTVIDPVSWSLAQARSTSIIR